MMHSTWIKRGARVAPLPISKSTSIQAGGAPTIRLIFRESTYAKPLTLVGKTEHSIQDLPVYVIQGVYSLNGKPTTVEWIDPDGKKGVSKFSDFPGGWVPLPPAPERTRFDQILDSK